MYVCMHIYAWTRDLWVWTRDLWYEPEISSMDQTSLVWTNKRQHKSPYCSWTITQKNVKKDRCKGEE